MMMAVEDDRAGSITTTDSSEGMNLSPVLNEEFPENNVTVRPIEDRGQWIHHRSCTSGRTIINVAMIVILTAGLVAYSYLYLYPSHLPPTQVEIGTDVSEVLGIQHSGKVKFRDDIGLEKDPLVIFREHGYTWGRVRVMVDPDGTYGLFQNIDYVKEMARALVKLNMKILLDFHYSHWWADPGNQWIPNTWKHTEQLDPNKIPVQELEDRVYEHTRQVMDELVAQNTIPAAVQIGNEVNTGMLWEVGRLPDEMSNFVGFTRAAYNAIQDAVAPTSREQMPKIVIHLAAGGWKDYTEEWIRNYTLAGGQFDVIGLSYYPMWHGTLEELQANLVNLARVFPEKAAWIVETAYYWTKAIPESDDQDDPSLVFPQTPEGQFMFLRQLRQTVERVGRSSAIFYWGSHWTQSDLWMKADEKWTDADRRALFDDQGRILPAVAALTQQDL